MYDTTVNREFVKTELDYRLDRARQDLAGRRRRRSLGRRHQADGLTWNTVR